MAQPERDRRPTRRRVRDITAVALIAAGVAGLVTAACLWHVLAGAAAASAALITAGVALGVE